MAFIGMQRVVAAPVSSLNASAAPTYGTGFLVGKAISANLTINRNNNPLRADDADAENDNGITGISVEIGTDDLMEEVQEKMGLLKKASGSDDYIETDASAKEVGIGYIRVRRKNGVTSYQGVWIYRALFGHGAEAAATKGQNIDWQTPTISGNALVAYSDSDGNAVFRTKANFTTLAEAETWLNTKGNINS